jgi:hypothetical protein
MSFVLDFSWNEPCSVLINVECCVVLYLDRRHN